MPERQIDLFGYELPGDTQTIGDVMMGHLANPRSHEDFPATLRKLIDNRFERLEIRASRRRLLRGRCIIGQAEQPLDVDRRYALSPLCPTMIFGDIQGNPVKIVVRAPDRTDGVRPGKAKPCVLHCIAGVID